jgi:hypothetical protein
MGKLIITELFLVKPNWNRTFMGEIRRDVINGKPIIYGKVNIDIYILSSSAGTQKELGVLLDNASTLVLKGKINEVIKSGVVKLELSDTLLN